MSSTPSIRTDAARPDAASPVPDKLFFRIGEVARIVAVAPYVLRYWESEFPQLAPHKGSGGQRRYQRADVELALTIRDMLYRDGFTIAGARRRLEEKRQRPLAAVAGASSGASSGAPVVPAGPAATASPVPSPPPVANAAEVGGTVGGDAQVDVQVDVQGVRQGLQELLQLLDNTDARRANVRSERSGGRLE